jgi:hypothetical protein
VAIGGGGSRRVSVSHGHDHDCACTPVVATIAAAGAATIASMLNHQMAVLREIFFIIKF